VTGLSLELAELAGAAVVALLVLALVLRHRHLERVARARARWGDSQAHVRVVRDDGRPAA
jgi:hypothetical protein